MKPILIGLTIIVSMVGIASASETDFRWFRFDQSWCLERGESKFCLPEPTSVGSITPEYVEFEHVRLGDSGSTFLTFSFNSSGEYSRVSKHDSRVSLHEESEIQGILVKTFYIGTSLGIEMRLADNTSVTLVGGDVDDLMRLATEIAARWME